LDSSIVQGPVSVAPNPNITIRNFFIAVRRLAAQLARLALEVLQLRRVERQLHLRTRSRRRAGHTAMKKLRIVILGFGTARQKTVLE
jgi:hypothetical protein